MEKCFKCSQNKVIPQMTDVPFMGIKGYTVYVEAMVCQNCGFIVLNDTQTDKYAKTTAYFTLAQKDDTTQ